MSQELAPLADPRLHAIVARTQAVGSKIPRLATMVSGERLKQADFRHHVMTAVWQVFVEAGGSLDNLDAFPWGTTVERNGQTIPIEENLMRLAVAEVYQELMGRQSAAGDARVRNRSRKNFDCVNQYTWTAWEQDEARTASEYSSPIEQEERMREKEMLSLLEKLRGAVGARELRWLIERTAQNKSLYEQVEDVVMADETYKGPHGVDFWRQCNADHLRKTGRTDEGFERYVKACNVINVAVFRAKQKARKALGEEWGEQAREMVY